MSAINYTHNLFPYPAKFPAEPIRKHIVNYSKVGDTILDPFCGSGTVLVESLLHNRNSIGVDLNPVSCLVSKVKSRIYTKRQLEIIRNVINDVENAISNYKTWKSRILETTPLQSYDNIDHWFKKVIIEELTAIKADFLNNKDPYVRDLLWMGFLNIIVATSKQENDTRYAAIEKPEVKAKYPLNRFKNTLNNYLKVLEKELNGLSNIKASATVYNGNSNLILDEIKSNSVSLVITSPPYINTFDYYLYHKHRIYWMDESPQLVRKSEIGCHHRIDTKTYEHAFEEYSDDLLKIMIKSNKCLKLNGHFVWLIGDGIVKSQVVKANELLVDLSSKSGYVVEDIATTSLRDVSKGFIKGRTLDLKKHHTVILKKIKNADSKY